MRILLTAAIAASLAAGSLSALAQTAPAPTPAKQKACKKLKDENACTTGRTDCAWSKPGDEKGKCKKAPKPKTT
jgi:uncharacterized membrane protein